MIVCTKPTDVQNSLHKIELCLNVDIPPNALSINKIGCTLGKPSNWWSISAFITPHIGSIHRHSSILRLNLLYVVHSVH